MGYVYGTRKYGEGLYSRWPDHWRANVCKVEGWQSKACAQPVWTPNRPAPPISSIPPWQPVKVT